MENTINNSNNSDSSANNIDNDDRRKLIWDSLIFLSNQRSKSLMKLSIIRRNKDLILNEESKALYEARRIRDRILKEIDINSKYLTKQDKDNLGINNDNLE